MADRQVEGPAAIVPHWGLVVGHLAHGLSWVALAVLAARGELGWSLPGLAWVHLVTLGWLTLVSLAMLVHVLEEVLGLRWPGGLAVRRTLAPYSLGVGVLVTGFWLARPTVLAAGATVVVLAIAAWLVFAIGAFRSFEPAPGRSSRAMRAFQIVLAMLATTATLGLGMALTLALGGPAWWLATAPAMHAHAGGLGWITLLVVGVAQRTMVALFGRGPGTVAFHVLALSALLLATGLVLLGLAASWWWALAAALLAGGVAAVAHAADVALLLRHATRVHRAPQAFVVASGAWLGVAVALGAGVLAGRDWQPAYALVALVGWAGQMVDGHLHHVPAVALGRWLGVAVGEPGDWFDARLSWGAFVAFQLAIGLCLCGGLGHAPPLVLAGALLGLCGWAAMTANVARVALGLRRARR